MKAKGSPAFPRSCPTWTRHRHPLLPRRNRPARRHPADAQPRSLLNRNRSSRLSVRRIKSLRNRRLARLAASGCWAWLPSLACFGSSASPTSPRVHRLPPTHRPRRVQRRAIRRLLNRKPPPCHKNQSRQLVRTWCFQRLRFGIAWRRTSAWRARRPLSTTTATPMWISSTPWWLTTTAAVAVSAIEAVHWRARAAMSSRTEANFRQKAGADSLAVHPRVPCRHQIGRASCRERV